MLLFDLRFEKKLFRAFSNKMNKNKMTFLIPDEKIGTP